MTAIQIVMLIVVLVAFVWDATAHTMHFLLFKALLLRVAVLEKLAPNAEENHAPEFVDDGEMDPDDNSYTIDGAPRETNSNGIPIVRRMRTGDELPAE